ncbi:DNA helicase II [Corynebacterium yudongzhengii]|uniref:DNA 3'-5' helicase n=1 Tax=Corynebacterium yudongzhengii TaxID=2080740 RepID=A0A2U1T4Z1_9CORY|nr:UvrD-helicase domain-containing protein [Corynebacterium yudongzhengii]AWB81426.1 DNA helicase II [Corynebacterium yudongzhengii]PWC01076.1 ATP-dependent helicase [Corynebacterium yudongzhengii]
MAEISPRLLAQILQGPDRRPNDQQVAATAAPPGPMLVVAGAGAGKTETMASRVLWLVANGYVDPDEVLGLTFTRKAAQELSHRIRHQLRTLAGSPKIRDLDPSGELREKLTTQQPTVLTYDSYAGQLIRQYGLLVPVEPDARLITEAELYALAHRVVTDYTGALTTTNEVPWVTETVLKLATEMDNALLDEDTVAERTQLFIDTAHELPKRQSNRKNSPEFPSDLRKWLNCQQLRLDLLPVVRALKNTLRDEGLVTFNEQMSVAARLVSQRPLVADSQRRRYRVVMLDEYQDTSHAQRILLSHLYGTPEGVEREVDESLTVTAVGDPMQAIYGWRGATVENLEEFVNDFPRRADTARRQELTTSWRNPGDVLEMANDVSEGVFFPNGETAGRQRPVAKLEPREDAGPGEVSLAHYESEKEEISAIADVMEHHFHATHDAGKPFTGAVLVRKNKQSQPIAQELAARGIPYEIVGLGGLLTMPEVADIVAIATMLIRPGNSQAALRILSGPLVGLGMKDLTALVERARNLSGRKERTVLPDDPTERLLTQLDEVTQDPPEQMAGLGDAVADIGEPERYSPAGLRRLQELSAKLRHLRTTSLAKSLPDLFADIETVFDIRTEILSRPDAVERGGAVHLDKLLSTVAAYHGDSLAGLLDYFELAKEHENGLEPGEVTVREDRVQILTAHKAKGLQWDVVAVAHADKATYTSLTETYLTKPYLVPPADAGERYEEAGDRKDFTDGGKEWIETVKAEQAEEAARLFYVAMTRTERVLSITASGKEPYAPFAQLKEKFPQVVTHWAVAAEKTTDKEEPKTGLFPALDVDEDTGAGAAFVRSALEELPAASRGETFDFWEREVDALIEEHEALSAPVVEVEIPGDLTATDMVNLSADREQFARRSRRPVPFKPNAYAKRGTAFHQWLEDRFGAQSLLDEDQLPGIGEPDLDDEQVAELKDAFLRSPWAQRTPTYVEYPFEVAIGTTMVRGRMDAIFRQPDGSWLIVDWKTGRPPVGEQKRSAEMQLAVYREAWRRIVGEDVPVDAEFYYVLHDQRLKPDDLYDGERLKEMLSLSAEGEKR